MLSHWCLSIGRRAGRHLLVLLLRVNLLLLHGHLLLLLIVQLLTRTAIVDDVLIIRRHHMLYWQVIGIHLRPSLVHILPRWRILHNLLWRTLHNLLWRSSLRSWLCNKDRGWIIWIEESQIVAELLRINDILEIKRLIILIVSQLLEAKPDAL